eukprot:scaffold432_cov69-Cyclotella_meneghiniana.AAC.19
MVVASLALLTTLSIPSSQTSDPVCGFPVDNSKAIEMFHRASELRYSLAHDNLSFIYSGGCGIELNTEKAIYHCQVAAKV